MESSSQDSSAIAVACPQLGRPRPGHGRRMRTAWAGALVGCALAGTLGAGVAGPGASPTPTGPLAPTVALADEAADAPAGDEAAEQSATAFQQASSPVTDAVPSEVQQRVEDSAAAYNDAVAARQQVEEQIADTEARIAELEAQLPELQDKAADAISASYKYQLNGGGLLELILHSDSFETFVSTLTYLNAIQGANTDQINELLAAQAELDEQRSELDGAMQQAEQAEQQAADALAEAQAAREEAIRQAQEAARRAAEEAARQAEAAAAAQQPAGDAATGGTDASPTPDAGTGDAGAEQGGTQGTTDGGATESAPAPEEPAPDTGDAGDTGGGDTGPVDWSSDKDAFVASWAGRLDAYLSGSPLAGQGATFAAAAWDYGIDPRWSPAIAYVESSLGAYCFLPHNAWGWGSSSWGSWEEAIYAQVAGLARGYGPTFDYDDALSYCPPSADAWYSSVLGQMNSI